MNTKAIPPDYYAQPHGPEKLRGLKLVAAWFALFAGGWALVYVFVILFIRAI